MKTPRIADFRHKITLLKATYTLDSELNRIETLKPIQTVWAVVEAKKSVDDLTSAGYRPEIEYEITIRNQTIECDYVKYNNKTLRLVSPWFPVGNYISIKAVEIV